MKAKEIREIMKDIGDWVDWEGFTADQFLAGDPEIEVNGIAVSWMPTFANLEKAQALECNLFVSHEPLYLATIDSEGKVIDKMTHPKLGGIRKPTYLKPDDPWVRKKKWLEDAGITVYRCHDFWDDYPEVGIHGAWAKWLGFEGKPSDQRKFLELHHFPETTLINFAKKILDKVKPLGQEVIHIVGDYKKKVSSIALGTGAICNYRSMNDMGADVLLLTDDGTRTWESGQWSLDSGIPLIIVGHSTAEEPGMITLTKFISDKFPDIPVRHIPVGCIYTSLK